jgi:predicted RNA-binding Zn-ribbon protein involved in translation (DUF1610 family)
MAFREMEKWVSKLGIAPRQLQKKTVGTELREFDCVCAVMDLPYILRYEVAASGLLKLLESVKGNGAAQAGPRANKRSDRSVEEQFESTVYPCPWCGATGLTKCGACRRLVCTGRVHGKVFHCRSSCGAYGIPVPVPGFRGESRSGGTRTNTALPNTSNQALVSRAGTSLARKS